MRCLRAIPLWVVLISVSACSTPGKMVVDPEAKPALAVLRGCSNAVQSAKGTGGLTMAVEGRPTQNVRLVWIADRHRSLRLEVLGIWGRSLYKLLLTDGKFYLHDLTVGKYFQGTAKKYTLKRLLGLAVDPQHLRAVLLGCLPVAPFRKAELNPRENGTKQYLSLYGPWNRLVEKVKLDADPPETRQAEFFDGWKELQYVVTLKHFREVDGVLFPGTIVVSKEDIGMLSLDVTRVYLNPPVREGTFDPESFRNLEKGPE